MYRDFAPEHLRTVDNRRCCLTACYHEGSWGVEDARSLEWERP